MAAASSGSRARIVPLARETFREFRRHRSQWLAAAIAYFTTFAVAPLIIVVVELAGFALGQHRETLNALYGYLQQSAGTSAAAGIQAIVQSTFSQPHTSHIAQIVSWVVFVFAAIGLFAALQQALNIVWDVEPEKQGVLATIWNRIVSFGMVLIVAVLLLASVALNSVLTAGAQGLASANPAFPVLAKVLYFVVSWAIVTVLFALIFEYLPACRIAWGDVWQGAALSSLLFVIGQFLLGWYLGKTGISSTYGAFGGIIAFLIWANYSAQIMLFGAEFTHVYARRHGSQRDDAEASGEVPTVHSRDATSTSAGARSSR
jgi:membrane protein